VPGGARQGSQTLGAVTPPLDEQWRTAARDDAGVKGPWQPAIPGDTLDKGAWWQIFQDQRLNALQQQALNHSPSLQVAAARLQQAHDAVAISGAASLPRVDLGLKANRTRTSANRPGASAQAQALSSTQNDVLLNGTVSYELDLFGRQRDDQAAALATEQQNQADLLKARLVLSADLAALYFNARAVDAEIGVLQEGLQAQKRALTLLVARHEGGMASNLDVAQQQAQIDATSTQLTLLRKQRDQLEHGLATLTGTPASQFTLEVASLPSAIPVIPVALPSDVLQRPPDVASAERAVAAANAQLGLAAKAWFPRISLNASGGWEGKDIARLIDAPGLIWTAGSGAIAVTSGDGQCPHGVVHCPGPLCRRAVDLSRRGHSPAERAEQPALVHTVAQPAIAGHHLPHQGPGLSQSPLISTRTY
jgi:multidrug efflux system outer membrane protein